MSDRVQAEICVISYEMVSKECLTNKNSIWTYYLVKHGPLKCTIKLHFQIWTMISNWSLDINFQAYVVIFILRTVIHLSPFIYYKIKFAKENRFKFTKHT